MTDKAIAARITHIASAITIIAIFGWAFAFHCWYTTPTTVNAQVIPAIVVEWQPNSENVRPYATSFAWYNAHGFTHVCVHKIKSPRNTGDRDIFFGCIPGAPDVLAATGVAVMQTIPIDGAYAPYIGDVYRADFIRSDGSRFSIESTPLRVPYYAVMTLPIIFGIATDIGIQ